MRVRRTILLVTLASLCGSAFLLTVGMVPAAVAATRFGSLGSGSGQFESPEDIAVDQATGDIYVADGVNLRIDVFSASGSFLFAFGWGVNAASPVDGPQTCTTSCRAGLQGSGAGEFTGLGPTGLAVDNELASPSYGDVYVVDDSDFRVQKFSASGEFLSMFGGDVNATSGGNLCVASEACKGGVQGTADGEFDWARRGSDIAVGPGGKVYVGDRARVQVFESSGAWREDISLSGLSSTGMVTALVVDSSGDVFVKIGNTKNQEGAVAGVHEFEPDGTEKSTQFDAGSTTAEELALDGSGDVFVGDSGGGFHVLEYDSTGKKLTSFGSNTVEQALDGMTYSASLGQLYVGGYSHHEEEASVWTLTPPTLGPPAIEPGGVSATPGERGRATLEAKFNPGGFETTYHLEYVAAKAFNANGYVGAARTPEVKVEASLEAQSVSAALTGLVPGETYHYRFAATNSQGTTTGADQTFEETPAALIHGPWTSNVSGTSATLAAEIDPLGVSTEYSVEYGTTESYGQSVSGSVGNGESYVLIGVHRQELSPGTVYHYRIVTHNAVGTVEGPDHTFTTQPAGGAELGLPDGRAWELVSPVQKGDALIEFIPGYAVDIQAASDGSGITYASFGQVGEGPVGHTTKSYVLSSRGADGWSTRDISLPEDLPSEEESSAHLLSGGVEYLRFSPSLSLGVAAALAYTPPLSPAVTEECTHLYLRDNTTGGFTPIVAPEMVASGTNLCATDPGKEAMSVYAATPDLSHLVVWSPVPLESKSYGGEFYEVSGEEVLPIAVLPDGKEVPTGRVSGEAVNLGGEAATFGSAQRAISNDGRWVAWTLGDPYDEPNVPLYVRDMVAGKTVQVGEPNARFQTMNASGSEIFFLEDGDLYVFDTATDTQIDLTPGHGAGEPNAGVQEAVSDVSEDGSYVYFVAKGVLAEGAVSGEPNLYLSHEEAGAWSTSYIATLSPEDKPDWYLESFGIGTSAPALEHVTSRVSPDGRYLAFMSDRSLTGYDNVDASSPPGEPRRDEEVYLYDAGTGRLVCASCNPSGARPAGILDATGNSLLVDRPFIWTDTISGSNHWLAGSLPGWDEGEHGRAVYQPRYLSDDGRLFFDSPDDLVAQATNGLEDVYEYEPPAGGETAASDSCTTASPTFGERSGGCVSLISSGTANSEAAFFDASEDGDDVFFLTASRLVPEDVDTAYDVYDAHVCLSAVPCRTAPVQPPPCTSGDSCKAAPLLQPAIFGAPASATFSGAGNMAAGSTSPSGTRPKSLTPAQKLARALAVCQKKKVKQKRAACEKQVKKRYSAKRSREANATRKGTR